MAHVILVTGGARSGKSAYALRRAEGFARRCFIATAVAFDDETRDRIARHREERGAVWETIEAPHDVAGVLNGIDDPRAAVVVDCLTVWMGNLMHADPACTETAPPCDALVDALGHSRAGTVILVTNEVGMSIVPENALARRFRDVAGRLNQRVAAAADEVVLTVCGQALVIKGSESKR